MVLQTLSYILWYNFFFNRPFLFFSKIGSKTPRSGTNEVRISIICYQEIKNRIYREKIEKNYLKISDKNLPSLGKPQRDTLHFKIRIKILFWWIYNKKNSFRPIFGVFLWQIKEVIKYTQSFFLGPTITPEVSLKMVLKESLPGEHHCFLGPIIIGIKYLMFLSQFSLFWHSWGFFYELWGQ